MPRGDATWLAAERAQPDTDEVAPGLTRGAVVAWHRRPPTPVGARLICDQAVGTGATVDVYRRAEPTEPCPGVLFVHGGAWEAGHPHAHIRRCAELAARGWVAATLRYRLAGEAPWPAQLDDVRAARRWLVDHGADLGLDGARLALAGDSAGAHLALLDALGDDDGLPPVAALALWHPVTDLRGLAGELGDAAARLLGSRADAVLAEASPIVRLAGTGRIPPILTIAGADDRLTTLGSIRRFHAALDRAGADHELAVWDGGHAFDWAPETWLETFERSQRFLERRLGGSGRPARAHR